LLTTSAGQAKPSSEKKGSPSIRLRGEETTTQGEGLKEGEGVHNGEESVKVAKGAPGS